MSQSGTEASHRAVRPGVSRRRVLSGLAVMAGLPILAACSSNDPLADQAGNAGGKNYIAGDGSVMEVAADERGEPVEFSSTTFDGDEVSISDWRGTPMVLNFWYAACAPCRVEAPDLASLSESFSDDVQFLGVNVRDEKETAEAFERNFGITYPSLEERGGKALLALTDYVPPQAVPTTLVLDAEGRVASRVLGSVEGSTLRALIQSVVDEAS